MSTGVATGFPPACRRLTAPAAVAVQCSVGRRACVAGSLARHRSTAAPTGARAVTSQGTAHRRPQIGAFGWPTRRHRAATNSGDRDHEAHLPTEHPPAQAQAWLHAPHAHAGRSNHHQAAAGKGPQAVDGLNNPEGGAELGSARPVARGSRCRAGGRSRRAPCGPGAAPGRRASYRGRTGTARAATAHAPFSTPPQQRHPGRAHGPERGARCGCGRPRHRADGIWRCSRRWTQARYRPRRDTGGGGGRAQGGWGRATQPGQAAPTGGPGGRNASCGARRGGCRPRRRADR